LRRLHGAGVHAFRASVDHQVLNELLARRVADRRLLELLRSLIAHGAEEPGIGMPIGNLTSQMFANLYLDRLDHFVREDLRARHYLRYMDDFVLLLGSRDDAWARLAEIETFVREHLRLRLNPRRVVVAPLASPRDVLGDVHQRDGSLRVRRRSVRRLWRRLAVLEHGLRTDQVEWSSARASVASWMGLARHADAFALSRTIFTARDVRNIGKRLLIQRLSLPGRAT
jgi:RNA-directed DNA polymerase